MTNIIPLKVIRVGGDTTALSEFNVGDTVAPAYIPDPTLIGCVNVTHESANNPHSITAAMLGAATTADLNSHINSSNIHRSMDDGVVSSTSLWSSNKITVALSTKSGTSHAHNDRYYTKAQTDVIAMQVGITQFDLNPDTLNNKIIAGDGIQLSTPFGAGSVQQLEITANPDIKMGLVGSLNMPVYLDNVSGSVVTTSMQQYLWAENRIGSNEWIKIGRATDSLSGHIMPFNGVIIGITAHCENTLTIVNRNINLYINGTLTTTGMAVLTGGANASYINMNHNTSFNAGDKLRLRGDNGGVIEDSVFTVYVRFTGTFI